jgi:tetratricopeptide (TPR) repeat protein
MISAGQTLDQAWKCLQAGQLREAELLFGQVLQDDPNHVDALNSLGVIAGQTGRDDLARDYLIRALHLKPEFAAAHNNLGNVLIRMKRLPQAVDSYQQALRVQPDFAEARKNLGIALHQQGLQVKAGLKQALRQVPQGFGMAWKHFQAGQFDEAERLFLQVLQADPNQVDALHLLGLIAGQRGRNDVAVEYLARAVRLAPDFAEVHNNLGNALTRQGKLAEAVASYQQAVHLKPDYAEAYGNMGTALMEQGKTEEALASFQRGLALKANDPAAHNNLATALMRQGRPAEAVASFQEALQINPVYAEVHSNLGQALMELGQFQEAVASFKQALHLKPAMAKAHYNLGTALMQLGQMQEAEASIRQALHHEPNMVEAHNNLGIALREQRHLEDAAACFRYALTLNSNSFEAWNNLGVVQLCQGRLEDAAADFRQAVNLNPNYLDAYYNLAASLMHQGHFEEAIAAYQDAVRVSSNSALAHRHLAMAWLMLGDFEQGWREYEWRWQCDDYKAPTFRQPLWDGRALDRQTILLRAEGGFGDTLHFIRYAPLVKERGGTVLVSCHQALIPLLSACSGIDRLVDQNLPMPDFDVQAPLISLPWILGVPDKFPAKVPYLCVEGERVARWRGEIGSGTSFKIGIFWQGNPKYPADRQRSFPLSLFALLTELSGVQLFSLQKGPGTEQIAGMAVHYPVTDLGSRLDLGAGAFMDTAAAMQSLDLIIAPDTAIAHLAGALGVPVWVALQLMPDWRWLLGRDDSPWYPTMRLFRQTRLGDWDEVFARIASEVARVIAKPKRRFRSRRT